MGKNRRLKTPPAQKGKRVSLTEPPNYDNNPPIFSLERIQSGKYCLSNQIQQDKAAFADAIYKRRNTTWREIKQIDRHALGFEKIAQNSIKAPIPNFVTDDMDHFIAFRFSGNKPMVGYRQKDVFFVLWFDSDFTLYDHG